MVKTAGEASGAGPIRSLNLPVPVDVEEDEHQRPASLVLRGHRLRVSSIDDLWEVADEWWRPGPVARRYCMVTMEGGVRITLFRDLVDGAWYRQRG